MMFGIKFTDGSLGPGGVFLVALVRTVAIGLLIHWAIEWWQQ